MDGKKRVEFKIVTSLRGGIKYQVSYHECVTYLNNTGIMEN